MKSIKQEDRALSLVVPGKKVWRILFRLYLLVIILLATLPLNSSSQIALNNTYVIHIRLDHLFHGAMMLPWVFLAAAGTRMSSFTLAATGLLAAVLLEGVQLFLTYRAFNSNDLIYNLAGLAAGWFIYTIYHLNK